MNLEERQRDVLAWYQREERFLSADFLASIPWDDVRKHGLESDLVGTLYYMRDVEKLTDRYYNELQRTPTGKNRPIREFMGRWSKEESLHGDLLNRFLEEAGYPSDADWYEWVKRAMPGWYKFESQYLTPLVTMWFGRDFSAVHMTWGAINEYSTMNGYARLRQKARHPVLDKILDGIMHEEARHAQFYWRIARIMLEDSPYRQKLARFFIDTFWSPVGQGAKRREDTRNVIRALFGGEDGVRFFDRRVAAVVRRLPGFSDCKTITDAIAAAALA